MLHSEGTLTNIKLKILSESFDKEDISVDKSKIANRDGNKISSEYKIVYDTTEQDANETDFAPDANIIRGQIVSIMFRYASHKVMDTVTLEENLHLTDANEISEYAVTAMNWPVGSGIMNVKSGYYNQS